MRHRGCILQEVEPVTGRLVPVDGVEVKLTQQSPLKDLFTVRRQRTGEACKKNGLDTLFLMISKQQ